MPNEGHCILRYQIGRGVRSYLYKEITLYLPPFLNVIKCHVWQINLLEERGNLLKSEYSSWMALRVYSLFNFKRK